MIIWLIGLSGAGKTTVGAALARRLKAQHTNLVFLDGDILRDVWGDQLTHDVKGRRKNALLIERLCTMLDAQGIHVVAAVLSIFPEYRQRNRATFSQYFEVFLDVPLDVLKKRDPKEIYAKAERGEIRNVVGIDIPFPRPADSDMIISGPDLSLDPEQMAARIAAALPELKV